MDKTKQGPVPPSKQATNDLKQIRDTLAEKRPDLAEKVDKIFIQGTVEPSSKK